MREINKSKNRPLNLEATRKGRHPEKGVDEIVFPTARPPGHAGLCPDELLHCGKRNGVQVKSLKHLNQLLDLPAPGGTHRIEVTQQPYTMYMSQKEAAKADRFIQMRAVPVLRRD
ncbi:MAG: hypothetical protein ACLT8E_05440 [Akkermansia sp.]